MLDFQIIYQEYNSKSELNLQLLYWLIYTWPFTFLLAFNFSKGDLELKSFAIPLSIPS
jgi:hypothetical protein